jgi:acetyl-CoA C-acetyltransferase
MMGMANPNTPVLVGVGQLQYRIKDLDEATEPLDMMLQACEKAAEDAGNPSLLSQVQSVRVILGMWQYENPARYIAEKFGASNVQTTSTPVGGNQVQYTVNQTAIDILAGKCDLVLITGAENGYSSAKARKAGTTLKWRETPGKYDAIIGYERAEHHANEMAKGIRQAIQVYPMYDNALRYHKGETIAQHKKRVSELWSRFNDVAQGNPNAWIRDNYTPEEIITPSATNRPISVPYTKLMNANSAVDMSAALIMCSIRKAEQLGIAKGKWIYPQAGADGVDHSNASIRDNFYTSPGVGITGNRALSLAGTSIDELSYVDLYSCFPSAVQIAARELGLEETAQLTVTGGLTFGGGPIMNYVMHSIATMVELLRANPGAKGLITGNGGNLSKHAHGIYSSEPPKQDFRFENVQAEIDRLPSRETLAEYHGDVTIESYTAMYAGEQPSIGHFACLTPDGKRVWANTQDKALLQSMTSEEFCGRAATIDSDGNIDVV